MQDIKMLQSEVRTEDKQDGELPYRLDLGLQSTYFLRDWHRMSDVSTWRGWQRRGAMVETPRIGTNLQDRIRLVSGTVTIGVRWSALSEDRNAGDLPTEPKRRACQAFQRTWTLLVGAIPAESAQERVVVGWDRARLALIRTGLVKGTGK
jgi:hypothetical protein